MSYTPIGLRNLPPLWRESRFPRELAALQRDPVYRGRDVPHGHGPALLIPGFMAGDASLQTMTGWLRRLGYRTSRAGIRLNTDCSSAALERLETRLEGLVERYEQPAVIVGQSRGGTFARALAARRPDLVSGIVTLGTPLIDQLAVHPLVMLNVRVMSKLGAAGLPGLFTPDCFDGECCAELRESLEEPFPSSEVGFVSIYSRSDGIVDWRSCLDPAAEHVLVDSSHCGMSVNADVYRVAARALAEFSERTALDPAAVAA
ncbi:MAG: esterase/lipase family protein [Solirubrobacteraceae bacterium]